MLKNIEWKIRLLELATKCWDMVKLYYELNEKEPEKRKMENATWFESEAKKYQQWANEL